MQARRLKVLSARDVAKVEYPEQWIDALKAFVQQQDGEYTTIYGLLLAVAGGSREAHFLRELLFWWGKGAERGAIWKSFREWLNSPAMLTRSNVETARRNLHEMGLIEFWQPEHSLHRSMRYRLHEFRLVARIATVCQMRTADVLELLCGGSAGACAETPQVHVQEPRKTYIRTNSTTKQHDDDGDSNSTLSKKVLDFSAELHSSEAEKLLVRFGCDAAGAKKVGHAEAKLVKTVITEAGGKTLKNPQGWVISEVMRRMKAGFEEQKKQVTADRSEIVVSDDDEMSLPGREDIEHGADWMTEFNKPKEDAENHPDWWHMVMDQLELQCGRAAWAELKHMRLLDNGSNDGVVRVEVQRDYALRWQRNVARLVMDIAGADDVEMSVSRNFLKAKAGK